MPDGREIYCANDHISEAMKVMVSLYEFEFALLDFRRAAVFIFHSAIPDSKARKWWPTLI